VTLVRVPVVHVGPIAGGPSVAAFERLVAAARESGFEVDHQSVVLGRFHAREPAWPTDPATGAAITLLVQCDADGVVEVAVGVPRDPAAATPTVDAPLDVRRALVRLSDALSAAARSTTPPVVAEP
jgi:hypothetical protein